MYLNYGQKLAKFESTPLYEHNIPKMGLLTAKQAQNMYTEFEDDCQRDGFSLTKTKDLLTTKS